MEGLLIAWAVDVGLLLFVVVMSLTFKLVVERIILIVVLRNGR